jgi:hypothetical protein
MLLCFGPGGATEPGGGRDGAAHAGGGGYELEQVKSNVFIAAGSKARIGEGVHREKSPKRMLPEAAPDGSEGALRKPEGESSPDGR